MFQALADTAWIAMNGQPERIDVICGSQALYSHFSHYERELTIPVTVQHSAEVRFSNGHEPVSVGVDDVVVITHTDRKAVAEVFTINDVLKA